MEAVISSWLNLEKIIFKPENETIYSTNDHLWHLWRSTVFVGFSLICLESLGFLYNTRQGFNRGFYIKTWFKCETALLFFSNMNHGLQKKTLYRKFFYCRLCKNHWITYCTHMKSHLIGVDEIADVMVSIKNINEN